MVRAILYARVSTRDKDQQPETQLFALRQYAQMRGWEITTEFVDYAGAKDMRGRVAWRELVALVRKHGGDVLLVLKLDRAFRTVKDTYDGVSFLQRYQVDFVSATQPIDTTGSVGKLILGVLAAVAEFERDLLVERTKEGMARAKAEGKHIGRPLGAKDKKKRRRAGYFARNQSWSQDQDLYPLA